jgi:NAD(P)-dependent dehydrogenase (short-subunit alcohol dehydrogenase family)
LQDLQSLAQSNKNIQVIKFDVKDYSSHEDLAEQVSVATEGKGLDVLINNAGVYNKVSLTDGDPSLILENIEVNAVAPFALTRVFLPLLRLSKASNNIGSPVIANITSKMGSIADNTSGGHYAYRTSKVAMNMLTKSLNVDLEPEGIKAVAIHPGWVLTDMGGPQAPLSSETSASNMINTIIRVSKGEIGNDGKIFLNFDGNTIPW